MGNRGSPLLHESSKYLRKHVEDSNKVFPAPWRGKFLRYKSLEEKLHGSGKGTKDGAFLVSVFEEVVNVNEVFKATAAEILKEHRSYQSPNWLQTISRVVKGKKGQDYDEGCLKAGACLEFAHINAVALRRVLNQHDQTHGSDLGRKFYDSLWQNQTGRAAFLHSPELLELSAIAQPAQGEKSDESKEAISLPHHNNDPCTDVVKLDHRCSVCLEVLFKPVALGCGHVFCTSCLKTAAGRKCDVRTFDQVARCVDPRVRCPECRQDGVFRRAAELTALGDTIRATYPRHWENRGKEEAAREVELKGELLRKLRGG
ncbi:hypothetical protein BSKO_00499 [Bryopsis sp. KO-2023]|nr:hypothetical protein BSKO_00499 [Bryopsis sp. KO-2023]